MEGHGEGEGEEEEDLLGTSQTSLAEFVPMESLHNQAQHDALMVLESGTSATSNVVLDDDDAEEFNVNAFECWKSRFVPIFGFTLGQRYAKALTTQCIHVDKPDPLSEYHHHEMAIPIGHRKVLNEVLERVRNLDNVEEEDGTPFESSFRHRTRERPFLITELQSTTRKLTGGLSWTDLEGEAENMQEFLSIVETKIIGKGSKEELPEHFIRAFLNNKPMPFSAKAHTKTGRTCAILLLRLPSVELVNDPLNVKDSTMATMTNRMILVYLPRGAKGGTLITYHKDPTSTMPWLDEMKRSAADLDTDGSGGMWNQVERLTREKFLMHFVFQSMISSRDVLESYRKQLEALIEIRVSKSPTAVVEWMNLIARQAQVLKRCLFGDKTAVSELCEALALEGQATLQILSDLSDVAEEIEGNAMDAMNLRMGLVGFRAQENMKLFTYVSAVTAPLAVLTGWYGMNFEHMPELHFEESYYALIGFAVFVAMSMIALIRWEHRDRGSSTDTDIQQIVDGDVDQGFYANLRSSIFRRVSATSMGSMPSSPLLSGEPQKDENFFFIPGVVQTDSGARLVAT